MPEAIENLIGQRAGRFRVSDDAPHRLVLSVPRGAVWVGVWTIVVLLGVACLASRAEFLGPNGTKALGAWAIIIGAFCVWRYLSDFTSYTFDSSAKMVTKRRILRVATWPRELLSSISLSVTHYGASEILVLKLHFHSSEEVLARAASTVQNAVILAIATRIAGLLDLPFHRFGEVVQGGAELREVLGQVGPAPGSGDGRDLLLNCPACGKKNTPAVAFDMTERWHGITHTSTWVRCLSCKTDLHSTVRADELSGISPEMLAVHVRYRLSLIYTATAILAAVLCPIPWIGLVMPIVATPINWRVRAWPKKVSLIALAISVVVTTVAAIVELK